MCSGTACRVEELGKDTACRVPTKGRRRIAAEALRLRLEKIYRIKTKSRWQNIRKKTHRKGYLQ